MLSFRPGSLIQAIQPSLAPTVFFSHHIIALGLPSRCRVNLALGWKVGTEKKIIIGTGAALTTSLEGRVVNLTATLAFPIMKFCKSPCVHWLSYTEVHD